MRSKQPVHSTSRNPAYRLSDGFLAISFDNLGAGATFSSLLQRPPTGRKRRRNNCKRHLPARAGHTRTRSAQNAPESTLPRPQAQQEQKTSTLRRAAPNEPWRTRTSSSSSRPRASATSQGSSASSTRTTFCLRRMSSRPQLRKRRRPRHPYRRRRPRRRRRRSRRLLQLILLLEGHLREVQGSPQERPAAAQEPKPRPRRRNAGERRRPRSTLIKEAYGISRGEYVRRSKNAA